MRFSGVSRTCIAWQMEIQIEITSGKLKLLVYTKTIVLFSWQMGFHMAFVPVPPLLLARFISITDKARENCNSSGMANTISYGMLSVSYCEKRYKRQHGSLVDLSGSYIHTVQCALCFL